MNFAEANQLGFPMNHNHIDIFFRQFTETEERITVEGLTQHTLEIGAPLYEDEPFSLLAYSGDKLVGSFIGKTFWNWLYIDLLWVSDKTRNSGLGARLMKEAEDKAREFKLTGIYCWTQSWQAEGFYRKMGYEEFTALRDFPPGHTRYGFRKYL
jgi:GNAT superfamily N-acetyltransferase